MGAAHSTVLEDVEREFHRLARNKGYLVRPKLLERRGGCAGRRRRGHRRRRRPPSFSLLLLLPRKHHPTQQTLQELVMMRSTYGVELTHIGVLYRLDE
jgi:hypothetical protein